MLRHAYGCAVKFHSPVLRAHLLVLPLAYASLCNERRLGA